MIQLPRLCGTRDHAQSIISQAPTDHSMLVSLKGVESVAPGFVDEFCKQLLSRRIDVVTFLHPSEKFLEYFMRSYRLRSAKFSVAWRD